MNRCDSHRPRYMRLLRLSGAAGALGVLIAAVATTVVGIAAASVWPTAVVLLLLAAATVWYGARHRTLLALQWRMAQALISSRDRCVERMSVPELTADVALSVRSDGTTAIAAASWPDAVVAMGYVSARDRGGQMELIRRTASGRLAEVWGRPARDIDKRYRALDFTGTAERAFELLAAPEKDALTAYAHGVNAAWRDSTAFESRFLGYRPEPWRPADSLLVSLYMYHALSWSEPGKRAEKVIRHVLPVDAAEFFLSEAHEGSRKPPADLSRHRGDANAHPGLIRVDTVAAGSNCWATAGRDGPLLACDLHLPLTLPNTMYEVDLSWGDEQVRGVIVPGLPSVLVGTNRHLAWGVTNLCGEVLDLVAADEADQTWPSAGTQRIRVRRGPDDLLDVNRSGDLVRSTDPLLGRPVAIRWAGFDPRALDLTFQRLAQARSVAAGLALLRASHGIALNVLLADRSGEMAHVVAGLLLRRPAGPNDSGPDYLDADHRPYSTSPPLVSANDAAFPDHPHRVGFDLDAGHRARRIRTALATTPRPTDQDMSDLQHDTATELYGRYRDLALRSLATADGPIRDLLREWSGSAMPASPVLGVLVRFRQILAERVLGPYFVRCREADPAFAYQPRAIDEPLLGIVDSRDPELLPPDCAGQTWDALVRSCLLESLAGARAGAGGRLPRWGELNSFRLVHPVLGLAPWAARLLCLPVKAQAGNLHCVRTCVPGFGAAVRAVLRPGQPQQGRIDLPAGQSGHPLSVHYADRHRRWAAYAPPAPRRPKTTCRYVLAAPASAPRSPEGASLVPPQMK